MERTFSLSLDGKQVPSAPKQDATSYFLYASYTHSRNPASTLVLKCAFRFPRCVRNDW